MELFKKVVWITGASSGIGEALAYEFNKKGTHLILSSRRIEELTRVKEACIDHVDTVKILPLDLADTGELSGKVQEAISLFGSVDMLINNGGISQRAYAADSNMETIRQLMEVNFFGTIALTKAVLPFMIEQNSGHIVVISSVMGKLGTKHRSAYAASKHALHGWFEALRAEEHDNNIRILMVMPGFIRTRVSINAVTGDGSAHGKMDEYQQKGMSAGLCAERIIEAMQRDREQVIIAGREGAGIYLKRWLPWLYRKIIRRVKVT